MRVILQDLKRIVQSLTLLVACAALCSIAAQEPNSKLTPSTTFTDAERSFWSFQPIVNPAAPAVGETNWPKSRLDQFILAGLEARGLRPAPPADKRTLIRRATFDLVGVPPTPEEVENFLADDSPDSFAKVIDRLLSSPHYGERWGRHWLDVSRYADSNGMDENMAYGNAWRYRDYVVRSFNCDKPYDQFVREQLAGDLIEEGSRQLAVGSSEASQRLVLAADRQLSNGSADRLTATGFLSLGPKMLAEDDPVKMEMDIIDEQLDTIGRTFMGLTIGCARCHDHKYDPILMEDYYALAGIFKSTKTMDNFKVVARWHERPLGTKDEIERQEAQQNEINGKKSEINKLTTQANESLLSEARRRSGNYLLAEAELRRHQALISDIKSQISESQSYPSGAIVVEAEEFVRGNVKKDFAGYGEKIGVIYNQGELPNFAEYDIEIAEAGAYQLELRFAAAESRPVRIAINGRAVRSDAAGKVTGSWFPDTQTWFAEGIFKLDGGKNTIRLERAGPFPHFDKMAIIPKKSSVGIITSAPMTAEQLAAASGLNPEFLQQWARTVDQAKGDPNSALYAWHVLTTAAPAESISSLFVDLRRSAERALASRYQELFDQADKTWQELKAGEKGKDAKELPDAMQESLRKILYDPKGPFAVPAKPESYYSDEAATALRKLRDELAPLEKSFTPLPEAMAVTEGKIENLRVHLRGNHLTLGTEVPRQFPRVLAGENQSPIDDKKSGRLQFAEWLTRPEHPLTSRVMVNRIWRWHFGEGLVRSTDNFGQLGDRPTNPPLIDWLARSFVESGWSIKAMHRIIMLSATYQMSTTPNEQASTIDPDNRLHWRMNRRRLEAEAIRDAILAVTGQLDPAIGGSLFEGKNRAYVPGYPNGIYDKYEFNRRSIYLPVLRSALYDVFQAFDFADPCTPNGERPATTVAPQALFMLNSKLVADQTRQLATRLLAQAELDDVSRIRQVYERAYGRPATDAETRRLMGFVGLYEAASVAGAANAAEHKLKAWQALCRAIIASNEFIYVE